MKKIKILLRKLIRPKNKVLFVNSLERGAKILDVGCGSHSSTVFKKIRPDIKYIGIDIQHYEMNKEDFLNCDKFILSNPDNFAIDISKYKSCFDAVICTHNLEHCNDYIAVVHSICTSLKIDGKVFFTFPCEESKNFPSRKGGLNFYDDNTHINLINYNNFINLIESLGLEVLYKNKNYKPIIPYLIGFILEPIAKLFKRQIGFMISTWSYFGFETVIIAKRKKI